MKTTLFDYHLPKNLIAQTPVRPRDHSKLMIIDRKKQTISHHHFYDLPKFLTPNDVLVINQSKVIPARFFGYKPTGGKVEILLLKKVKNYLWEVLTSPGLKMTSSLPQHYVGTVPVSFLDHFISVPGRTESSRFSKINQKVKIPKNNISAKIIDVKKDGIRLLQFSTTDEKQLFKFGHAPTPPYIKKYSTLAKYQTIYAKIPGSVAAPTAGFHFTKRLINQLKSCGVQIILITLHVGLGTFAPVKSKKVEDHKMHKEYFQISPKSLKQLTKTKKAGKRIIAVGTTSCRVLESLKQCDNGTMEQCSNETNLFIYPPYPFKLTDCLLTNFHLPKSTLLMLTSAFVSYPNLANLPNFTSFKKSLIGKSYQEAIKQKYRFYSFGDAMLII